MTLPDTLNTLALHQQAIVHVALFKAAWQTINQFATGKQLQAGMICILNTYKNQVIAVSVGFRFLNK
jgi:hypothetical protein